MFSLERKLNKLDRVKTTKLILSKKKLTEIPPVVFEFTNLEELDLSDNTLTTIPEAIGTLEKLKILKLNRNLLIDITNSISNLKNLEVLNLSKNKFQFFSRLHLYFTYTQKVVI